MRFFKLTYPDYLTDREMDSRNPVSSTSSHHIPGMDCPVCGTWSSSDRLRINLTMKDAPFRDVSFLTVKTWLKSRPVWAAALGVAEDLLAPGAKVGPPQGVCSSIIREDCVHPIPGEIWVRDRVRTAMLDAQLTGVSLVPFELSGVCDDAKLWELVVTGRAWRKGSTEESIWVCDVCYRESFPRPKALGVDESRWDGSDFIILDRNPNIIVATEKVAKLIQAERFSNLVAQAIV